MPDETISIAPAGWRYDGAVSVTFDVRVPDDTPPGDTIRVSGNLDALGRWDGVEFKR